jgi:hypothetical protein
MKKMGVLQLRCTPKPLAKLKDEFKVENNGKVRSLGHVPWLSTL